MVTQAWIRKDGVKKSIILDVAADAVKSLIHRPNPYNPNTTFNQKHPAGIFRIVRGHAQGAGPGFARNKGRLGSNMKSFAAQIKRSGLETIHGTLTQEPDGPMDVQTYTFSALCRLPITGTEV